MTPLLRPPGKLGSGSISFVRAEKRQARSAGDSNKAQGEASVICERNPGLTERKSQAHGVGARRPDGSRQRAASITRSAGSFRFTQDTQGSTARLATLRRYASPWALFGSPAFAGLARRNRPTKDQCRGKGGAFPHNGAAEPHAFLGGQFKLTHCRKLGVGEPAISCRDIH